MQQKNSKELKSEYDVILSKQKTQITKKEHNKEETYSN